MVIIFGYETKRERVENGLTLTDYCPKCQKPQQMHECISRKYFALYMLPLFPLEKGETFLQCAVDSDHQFVITKDHYDHARAQIEKNKRRLRKVIMRCPACDKKIRVPLTDTALRITCPHADCGERFEAWHG